MELNFIGKTKIFFDSKNVQLLLVIAMLIPLFLINVIDYHDWGGDFAQYIQQSINIVNGKIQNTSHYIFNPENNYLGPPSYSVGFPLLIAPVYGLFGNHIIVFSYFMTLILVVTMVCVFKFLNQYFNLMIALSGTMIFAFNPWILSFKGEILSDLPFSLFLLLSLLVYEKNKKNKKRKLIAFIVGILIGYSMLIKSIGILMLIAIIFDYLVSIISIKKSKPNKKMLREFSLAGILILSTLLTYLIIGFFIFPAKHESYSFFYSLFNFKELGNIVLNNLDYYIKIFQDFFHPRNGNWNFAPLITKAFALTFLIVGLFLRFTQKPGVKEFLLILYLFVILTFPNTTQGFRYLLPIFPILMYYIIYGLKSIQLEANKYKYFIIFFIVISIGLQYKRDIIRISNKTDITNSPQSPEAKELFQYIYKNTNINSLIVFNKPRVLGLYAKRDSYSIRQNADSVSTEKQINKLGFDFLLLCHDLEDKSLEKYINDNRKNLVTVFNNKRFLLYSKNQVN